MDLAERETTITYDQKDKLVRIFSAIAKDNNKLRKAGFHPVRGNGRDGYCYEVPLDRLRWLIRKPKAERIASRKHVATRGFKGKKGVSKGVIEMGSATSYVGIQMGDR